jgi:hypothetical protein
MTPVTQARLRRIVSFLLKETQAASIRQICAATAQPYLFSLRDPSSATHEEAPAPEQTKHARRRK